MRLSNQVAVGSPMARLGTTAAAGLALAVALAGAVLAASPSPSVPLVGASPSPSPSPSVSPDLAAVQVTGTLTIEGDDENWLEQTDVEYGLRQRYGQLVGHVETNDPRLTGSVTGFMSMDRFCDGQCPDRRRAQLGWSSVNIANEGGTWVGRRVGTHSDGTLASNFTTFYELAGAGGYEGLSAIIFETETVNESLSWAGVIFPGDLPPDRP
jgi:hypothetical protein